MKCRKLYKPAAAMIVLSMIVSSGSAGVLGAESNTKKEENIYVNLQDDGLADGVYVVNAYDLKKNQKIVDYGDYITIQNLSSSGELKEQNGKITTYANRGKFYYQGNLENAQIPWDFDISYEINGKKISAERLAGKTGNLKIRLKIKKNEKAKKGFFENYLLQVTMTLDTKKCKNIKADGASAANSGDQKQLIYNVMAGQEKTLEIKTDVKDFEMEPISINAVPMSFNIDAEQLNTGKLKDKTRALTGGVKQLNQGAKQLKTGSDAMEDGLFVYGEGMDALYQGAETLFGGIKKLNPSIKSYTSGVSKLEIGTGKLKKNTKDLPQLMNQMTNALKGLEEGSSAISDPKAWKQIEDGMKQMKTALTQMKQGLRMMDQQGLQPMEECLSLGGAVNGNIKLLKQGVTAADRSVGKLQGISNEYEEQVRDFYDILQKQNSTTKESGENITEEQVAENTEKGTYTEDHKETQEKTTVDENGNTVIVVTNNIYMTKTDVKTKTITRTRERSQMPYDNMDDLQNLYQRMKKNSASFQQLLNGEGKTSGLSELLRNLDQGVDQLESGLYGNKNSLKNSIARLRNQITGTGGMTDGIDAVLVGINSLEKALYEDQEKSMKSGVSNLNQGIAALQISTDSLPNQMKKLTTAIQQLSGGANQLIRHNSNLNSGAEALEKGARALKTGNEAMAVNTNEIVKGSESLANGARKLAGGTQKLEDQTKNMDGQILNGIKEEISKFSGEDYKAKSFVSSKNKKVSSVQFVMRTDGIKKEEKTETKKHEKKQTIWEKLKNLFYLIPF